MDITTRDGNKKRHAGKVSLNTFGAGLLLEGPIKKETANSRTTVTYLLSAKNSFLSKTSSVLYPYLDGSLPFDFLDLYGKVSVNSGEGSKNKSMKMKRCMTLTYRSAQHTLKKRKWEKQEVIKKLRKRLRR